MLNYSIIFLSLEWFNSHSIAGVGYALCFAPPIILGWFAGVYCDRYSPRVVILVAQNSYFISLLLIYLAFDFSSNMQLISLLVAAFFAGIGWSFVAPARFAALPFYLGKRSLVEGSIALNLMVMSGFGLAPLLLKYIIADGNWTFVLFTAFILIALSSCILWPLKFQFERPKADKTMTEIKQSLYFIRHSKPLIQLLSLAAVAYLLMGPMQVLLPSVAKQTLMLTDAEQGQFLSLVALSLIIGGLITMVLKMHLPFGYLLLGTIPLAGLGIGQLGNIYQVTQSATILVFSAICGGIAISLIVAGLQHYSPSHLRGRIMSIYTIVSQFIPAISGLFAGLLAGWYDYPEALQVFGITITALMIVALIAFKTIRRVKRLEHN